MKVFTIVQTSVWCIGIVSLLTGCTITKCKLTGTPGASYQGYVQMTTGYPQTNYAKLPDSWSAASLAFGGLDRLEKCEYHKVNTNDSLVVNLRTHGFKGIAEAPPGTEGVRIVREGKGYKAETF
jgi:hypothetical protein